MFCSLFFPAKIKVSQIPHVQKSSDEQKRISEMQTIRDIEADWKDQLPVFLYSYMHIFTEGDIALVTETIQNLALASGISVHSF